MKIFAAVYVIIFFLAVIYSLKFQWGKAGRDERGFQVIAKSYAIAFPLMPLGWLLVELYHDYVQELTYAQYKFTIWFVLTGIYIIHAATLFLYNRKM